MVAQHCTACEVQVSLPAVLKTARSATRATAVHRICIAPDVWQGSTYKAQERHGETKILTSTLCLTRA